MMGSTTSLTSLLSVRLLVSLEEEVNRPVKTKLENCCQILCGTAALSNTTAHTDTNTPWFKIYTTKFRSEKFLSFLG